MERNLECKAICGTKDDVCKWVNQYKKLIDLVSIIHDNDGFTVFFYWKPKDN